MSSPNQPNHRHNVHCLVDENDMGNVTRRALLSTTPVDDFCLHHPKHKLGVKTVHYPQHYHNRRRERRVDDYNNDDNDVNTRRSNHNREQQQQHQQRTVVNNNNNNHINTNSFIYDDDYNINNRYSSTIGTQLPPQQQRQYSYHSIYNNNNNNNNNNLFDFQQRHEDQHSLVKKDIDFLANAMDPSGLDDLGQGNSLFQAPLSQQNMKETRLRLEQDRQQQRGGLKQNTMLYSRDDDDNSTSLFMPRFEPQQQQQQQRQEQTQQQMKQMSFTPQDEEKSVQIPQQQKQQQQSVRSKPIVVLKDNAEQVKKELKKATTPPQQQQQTSTPTPQKTPSKMKQAFQSNIDKADGPLMNPSQNTTVMGFLPKKTNQRDVVHRVAISESHPQFEEIMQEMAQHRAVEAPTAGLLKPNARPNVVNNNASELQNKQERENFLQQQEYIKFHNEKQKALAAATLSPKQQRLEVLEQQSQQSQQQQRQPPTNPALFYKYQLQTRSSSLQGPYYKALSRRGLSLQQQKLDWDRNFKSKQLLFEKIRNNLKDNINNIDPESLSAAYTLWPQLFTTGTEDEITQALRENPNLIPTSTTTTTKQNIPAHYHKYRKIPWSNNPYSHELKKILRPLMAQPKNNLSTSGYNGYEDYHQQQQQEDNNNNTTTTTFTKRSANTNDNIRPLDTSYGAKQSVRDLQLLLIDDITQHPELFHPNKNADGSESEEHLGFWDNLSNWSERVVNASTAYLWKDRHTSPGHLPTDDDVRKAQEESYKRRQQKQQNANTNTNQQQPLTTQLTHSINNIIHPSSSSSNVTPITEDIQNTINTASTHLVESLNHIADLEDQDQLYTQHHHNQQKHYNHNNNNIINKNNNNTTKMASTSTTATNLVESLNHIADLEDQDQLYTHHEKHQQQPQQQKQRHQHYQQQQQQQQQMIRNDDVDHNFVKTTQNTTGTRNQHHPDLGIMVDDYSLLLPAPIFIPHSRVVDEVDHVVHDVVQAEKDFENKMDHQIDRVMHQRKL